MKTISEVIWLQIINHFSQSLFAIFTMLFWCFFSFLNAASVSVTAENFDQLFNKSAKLPVFVKLWATWCPHCREMQPQWELLANNTEFNGRLIIADIECEENREICKRFEGENYPRIYFVDASKNESTLYLGEREFPAFQLFIRKQLNFPLFALENDDLDKYYEMSNVTTIFIFEIPAGPDYEKNLELAKQIVYKRRHYQSQFLFRKVNEVQKPKIVVITSKNRTVEYDGDINDEKKVSQFMYSNSVPFLGMFTAFVMKHSVYEKKAVFILIHNESKIPSQESIDIADHATHFYPATSTDCVSSNWICRYTSINENTSIPEYLIFNRNEKVFWVYRGKDRDPETIKNWISNVYNRKVRSEGPGTGIMGAVLEQIYDERARNGGGGEFNLFYFAPIFLLLITIAILYDLSELIGFRKKNHKKEKKKNKKKTN